MKIDTSVIISTYNQPEWLEKVLWSYDRQTYKNFEVVIADDGSGEETKALIVKVKRAVSYSIQHIWHPDNGFQKTTILNKATVAAIGTYLVYTDGDCIARKDFLEAHIGKRKPGFFLSGGYFKLPMHISRLISKDDIESQRCFDINWLKSKGLEPSFKTNKLTSHGFKAWFLNTFTPTKATFDGMNVSGWKDNILEVNGFDQRMQYGGEDREIGERLMNTGIKFLQIRYSAICLHLYHDRPYKNDQALFKNQQIRKQTRKLRIKKTKFGIKKYE